ncbi:Pre-rRNA-processing protein TSR2 homolog [Linum perenne]
MDGGGDADNGSIKRLTAEALPVLNEGIYLVLSRWSALQLAVENEWGGRRSRQLADQLASDVFAWFTKSKAEPLYIDDLENILDEGMLTLNADVDDGSVEEVAEKLMIMHEECLEGNYRSVEKLRTAGPGAGIHQHKREAGSGDDDSSSEDDSDDEGGSIPGGRSNMAVDPPVPQPRSSSDNRGVVAEPKSNEAQTEDDGWTVVSSNRSRGRRN